MTIADTLLAEFDQEARITRKFFDQLPADKLTWQPHPKSMTAGQLAYHMAVVPGRVVQIAQQDEMPVPDFNRTNPQPASLQEILNALDESIATVKSILPTFTDEQMHATWRMTRDGQEVLAMPKVAVLRNIMLNHWYHHRGQLGVYLRLLGAKVPSAYGPSGDEAPDFLK
jgi:uncharacterized damage-inducible protein DinB